ncbi:uncharacterized protein HMPREF1541_06613 [Cyphellophora europaea CBS 101466]|uniref:SnoaL-like domain-containing protein n=1 Tax=Cyphellophora europaea (strain CBS 101466) TaxID=1220924 RepID=W2RPX9_CYPE1|nr:uncharacterized protein HMPREF1541_06613 [Cyphellophora europaea CBS 101466]ETN38576.1 hypothetical protein HMPREF1541_06613 [Cyphellophora europaea CBS 101466]
MAAIRPKQDAIDLILQFMYAIDTNDRTLLESSLHADVVYDQSGLEKVTGMPMPPIKGLRATADLLMGSVGRMDATHHVTNFRVQTLSPDDALEIKCYSISYHYRLGEAIVPDKEGFIAGNEYTSEVVKDDSGQWKLRKFAIRVLWCKGDLSVFGS